MSDDRLQALLTSIARVLQSEQRNRAVAAGMLPVQWAMLAYLREANRYSNTPQALGEYLALTKGTVSQSLKLLEARGWIKRQPDAKDRRVLRLSLTAAGRSRLGAPLDPGWTEAADALPDAESAAVETVLSELLTAWQRARQGRSFGVCRSCRHHVVEADGALCALTGEALTDEDGARICREHEIRDTTPAAA